MEVLHGTSSSLANVEIYMQVAKQGWGKVQLLNLGKVGLDFPIYLIPKVYPVDMLEHIL